MSQKIRIKLKSYDHNLVDKSAEKIVKTVKQLGAVVTVQFHYQHTRKSLQYYVHLTLIKNQESNSNCVHTKRYWTFTVLHLKQLMR